MVAISSSEKSRICLRSIIPLCPLRPKFLHAGLFSSVYDRLCPAL